MTPRLRAPPKLAEAFYNSPAWRALIASVKKARGCFCKRCGSTKRIIGDHIIERRDGGAELDPSNIELLCPACHAVKTAQSRARRAKGMT